MALEDSSPAATMSGLTAFVLGGSGEVGREILREVAANAAFSRVISIGRRELDLSTIVDPNDFNKVEQKVVDFEALNNYADAFQDCKLGFCALGTTRAKAGSGNAFVKVDRDYVACAAKLAREAGCQQFHLVSAQGANKNSWLLYPKTKGLVEEDVTNVGFDRVGIYRPGLLMCERGEQRTFENLAQGFAKRFDNSNRFSVSTSAVARAMIRNALRPFGNTVEILNNGDIVNLGFSQEQNNSIPQN